MHFSVSGSVIAFSALLSVLTGIIFGLFPALHSTRGDLITVIRAGKTRQEDFTFTIEMARTAELTGKDNWKKESRPSKSAPGQMTTWIVLKK